MRRLPIIALLLAIIFGLGLASGVLLRRLAASGPASRTYNTAGMLQQVQTLSQLVSVKYVLEKVVVLEVSPDSVLGQMFAGDSRVLMVAHGIVKAGTDLGKLKPGDFRVSERKVTIKLPPAEITDAYLDDRQTRVIERTTGRFRSFDKDLEQTARQNAVQDIRRAARSGGILKDAEERTRAQLTHLFRQLGFEQVEFSGP